MIALRAGRVRVRPDGRVDGIEERAQEEVVAERFHSLEALEERLPERRRVGRGLAGTEAERERLMEQARRLRMRGERAEDGGPGPESDLDRVAGVRAQAGDRAPVEPGPADQPG